MCPLEIGLKLEKQNLQTKVEPPPKLKVKFDVRPLDSVKHNLKLCIKFETQIEFVPALKELHASVQVSVVDAEIYSPF